MNDLIDSAAAKRWAASVNSAAALSGEIPAIIAGASVTGLSFVRSLGERGIPVFSLDHRSWEVGMLSRYSRPQVLPDPAERPADWVRFLLDAAGSLRCRPALIAVGDAHLRALMFDVERLAGAFSCALPPPKIFDKLVDKSSQYKLLGSAGAVLPATVSPKDEPEAVRAAAEVGLPCLVKPNLSDLWTRQSPSKLVLAHTVDQTLAAYRAMSAAGAGAVIQELIPGGDDALFTCLCHIDASGELRACFTKRKLRQFPPRFGNGSYQISVLNPEASDTSLRLLREIKYRGTASIEYKLDPRDGRLKLIEMNCRAVSGTYLAVLSGVDLPWIVYRDCIGRPLAPVTELAAGRTLVNLSWDLRAYFRSGDHSIRGFGRWARSVLEADADAIIQWRDMGPIIRTCSRFWR